VLLYHMSMDCIPESILALDNDQLRQQLIAAGIQPAPLTPTTRKLFQKKLARKLGKLPDSTGVIPLSSYSYVSSLKDDSQQKQSMFFIYEMSFSKHIFVKFP